MGENLDKFNVFMLENASKEDAFSLCKGLDVKKEHIFLYEDLKIDDVRKVINLSSSEIDYKQCFIFGEIGYVAQNSMLKMIEEPKENNYFVIYGKKNILDTIKSRAQVIKIKQKNQDLSKLYEFIKEKDSKGFLFHIKEMENNSKDEIIAILDKLSYECSLNGYTEYADYINKKIVTFKEFNLNKKLFLMALFLKIFGGK